MKNIKTKYRVILLISLLLIGSIFINYYNKINNFNSLIYPGVEIQGVDLSGKSKNEAVNIIKNSNLKNIENKKINLYSNKSNKTYMLEYSKINFEYDIKGAVDKAFEYGRRESFFKKIYLISGFDYVNCSLNFTYNKKYLENFVSLVQASENVNPVNAYLNISDDKINVIKEKQGYSLDKDLLLKELISKINGEVGSDTNLDIKFNDEAPKVTKDMLQTINAKISSFSTFYSGISSPERANNIELAVRSINGKVLMPGETFSYNDTVGERTLAKGYKYAPVIENNKMVMGLGGGICQVSTTLYNAAIRGNMEIVERNHHSLPVHYVSAGMDATVDFGNLDLKFKNNSKYPVYIEAVTTDGRIIFDLFTHNS